LPRRELASEPKPRIKFWKGSKSETMETDNNQNLSSRQSKEKGSEYRQVSGVSVSKLSMSMDSGHTNLGSNPGSAADCRIM
jgi:hypothetical protein